VFEGGSQGAARVGETSAALEEASAAVPEEYFFPYQSSLLLIGSGQRLGAAFTEQGIEAGERGLRIYPNSLELRTGLANGYLQLNRPEAAQAQLEDVWDADSRYLPSGLAYVRSLLDQGDVDGAKRALLVLKERFPEEPSIAELENAIATDSEG
jgi:hypothetical protein